MERLSTRSKASTSAFGSITKLRHDVANRGNVEEFSQSLPVEFLPCQPGNGEGSDTSGIVSLIKCNAFFITLFTRNMAFVRIVPGSSSRFHGTSLLDLTCYHAG